MFISGFSNAAFRLNGPAILSVSTGSIEARVIRVSRGLSDNPAGDDRCLSLGEVKLSSP